MGLLIGLVGLIVVLALSSILKGYVFSILWGWFIVPLGMPAVTVPWAIGISILVSLATYQYNANDEKKDPDGLTKALSVGLVLPLFSLLFGYIAHSFM
jgi:hypothetical protein